MPDKEKLMQLFTEFGIGYEDNPEGIEKGKGYTIIVCLQGKAKIDGYGDFFTIFEFDENGKFVEMGAWE